MVKRYRCAHRHYTVQGRSCPCHRSHEVRNRRPHRHCAFITHNLFPFYSNNDFFFAGEGNSQLKCPFAAHVRKTNPRDDLEAAPNGSTTSVEPNRIMRRGVPFGPELTAQEKAMGVTAHGRGLLFGCYQTNLVEGFRILQQS